MREQYGGWHSTKMTSNKEGPIPHVLELELDEQRTFLDSFDFVFSDCDGVIWPIVGSIPRTGEAINLLQKENKTCVFVSNNSLRSDEDYLGKFKSIGATRVRKNDLVHPSKAILSYLLEHKAGARVFSLASSTANQLWRDHGIDVETLDVGGQLNIPDVLPLIKTEHKVGAVVADININMNYIQIAKACQYLRQENCVFITGGTDMQMPLTPEIMVPGFQRIHECISEYSQKQPTVLGKPSAQLGEYIKKLYNVKDPKRCLFVGDSLAQDMAFGKLCGFQTLFVASTGAYSKDDMLSAPLEHQPDFYCDSFSNFIELFANTKGLPKRN